mgnify:CR=1 FL=1
MTQMHNLFVKNYTLEKQKFHYPDFNILDRCLNTDIYWTFKKTEKRDKFEEDLNWFISKVYKDLSNKLI